MLRIFQDAESSDFFDKRVTMPSTMAEAVRAGQVHLLYTNAPFAVIANVVVITVLTLLLWHTIAKSALLAWVAYSLLVVAGRAVLAWRYLRLPPSGRVGRFWQDAYLIAAGLSGLGWGAAGIWLFAEDSMPHQLFLAFVLGGMTAGAVPTMSAHLGTFLAFVLPTTLPVSVHLLIRGTDFGTAMGWLALLFVATTVFLAVKTNRLVLRSFRFLFENAELVTNLTAEIAERKRTEAALQQGEMQFRHLVEHANDVIYQTDAFGRFTFVNPTATRLMIYSEAELLGRRFTELIRTDQRRAAERFYGRQFVRKTPTTYYEFPAVAKDGSERWFGQNVQLLLDKDVPVGFQAVARDITERKRLEELLQRHTADLEQRVQERTAELAKTNAALLTEIEDRKRTERALERAQNFLNSLLEHIPNMMFVKDAAHLRFVLLNKASEDLLGIDRDSMLGKTDHDFFPNEQAHAFVARDRQALASGQPLDIPEEPIYTRGKGRRILHTVRVPIPDETGRPAYLLGFSVDITDRLMLEQQLRQAQKMEAIGRLAGGIAHDFNNLLTVIVGAAQLLLRRAAADDASRTRIERIIEASDRASSLTKQLLAFSRQQVLTFRLVNLNTVVAMMDDLLRRLIGDDVILATSLDPALGWVKADQGQLEQIILNLAVNARDAMPQGGTLHISTENIGPDHEGAAGRLVRLQVSDTGIGMDRETLKRLFEPFFTTKEPGKGTGLGLATVYGIVTQSGGTISVHSQPGEGAIFTIDLPRAEETAPTVPLTGPPAASAQGTETILLAEDQDLVRALTEDILRTHGYAVLAAESGPAALRLSQQHRGPIHLLLTDLAMPEMNGRELAQRLLAQRPDVKLLYMTGYEHKTAAASGGPDAPVLLKPLHVDELLRHLRQALDKEA